MNFIPERRSLKDLIQCMVQLLQIQFGTEHIGGPKVSQVSGFRRIDRQQADGERGRDQQRDGHGSGREQPTAGRVAVAGYDVTA